VLEEKRTYINEIIELYDVQQFFKNKIYSEYWDKDKLDDYNIVVDQLRYVINQKALEKIISCGAKTMVYISCNPKTQKRDVQILLENGYELKTLKIFNQFPRRVHVECVVLMSRVAPTE
jgi:hypothetical protein